MTRLTKTRLTKTRLTKTRLTMTGLLMTGLLTKKFLPGRALARLRADDRGAATAEYAIATLAAVGFAGLLVAILRSDAVKAMLLELVQRALSFAA